jgi:hypothetical protein
MYGCETRSLILSGEHRLTVFGNRVRRRISGSKREDVAEGWRRLHNEEPRNVYASQNIIRVIKSWRMRWARHVVRMHADEKCI